MTHGLGHHSNIWGDQDRSMIASSEGMERIVPAQVFKGAHGTCMSLARKIEHEGFITRPGRIGTGAYFWTAVEDEHVAISTHYAITWAEKARQREAFKDQENQEIAVIHIEVEADDEEILYLDDPAHHLDLQQELAEFAIKYFNLNSIFELTKIQFKEIELLLYGVVDLYIKLYEEELGDKKVKVLFKNQKPSTNDPLSMIVGNASCFAVRDTRCITSMHVSPA